MIGPSPQTQKRTTTMFFDQYGNLLVNIGANNQNTGQAPMSNSIPVTLASDQTPKVAATATRTSVAAAIADTALLTANPSRKGALFYNDSTAILYLAYGSATATTTNYTVQIPPGGYFELPPEPVFTGAIRGIWSAATGSVRITEVQ